MANTGYLYQDSTGTNHVVSDLNTAQKYGVGNIRNYNGDYANGYASGGVNQSLLGGIVGGGSQPNLTAPVIKQQNNDLYSKAMQNVSTNYSIPSTPSVPQQRQSLNYDQAQQRASQQLGYQYDKMRTDTLQALKNDQIRRGIFGQTDASQIEYNKAADLEAQKSSAIASLANSLVSNDQQAAGRDYANALQQYQLQYQAAMKPYELAQQQQQSQFNNLSKLWDMSQSKDQSDFNKKLQEAIMTGRFYLE